MYFPRSGSPLALLIAVVFCSLTAAMPQGKKKKES